MLNHTKEGRVSKDSKGETGHGVCRPASGHSI
jgi:hypothetical protein